MPRFVHVDVDGHALDLVITSGKRQLKALQTAVGGDIEVMMAPGSGLIIMNENGKGLGLPVNERATTIWRLLFPLSADHLVGDVLFAGGDANGEFADCPPELDAIIRQSAP